ncbi:1-aminocyclopropane-1-carboxylate deaminase/D-cysteine desulfhydrase [Pseudochelatococcus sp. B33]
MTVDNSLIAHDRVPLGFLPTPLETLERVGARLGIRLFIKRDDLNGFGGGGNKVRKLEFILPEALSARADTLITTGGLQSNHARIVAAAARKLGLRPLLVLEGRAPAQVQGNLLLDRLFDAEIVFVDPTDYAVGTTDLLDAQAERVQDRGGRPYIIPLGGAGARGAQGYINAIRETQAQLEAARLSPPDFLVVAAGTGSTLAALHVGVRWLWPATQVIGITVSRKDEAAYRAGVAQQATEAAGLAGLEGLWTADDIAIDTGYFTPGYGEPSAGGIEAIRLLAREEGILLDPVYTAKGFDGLIGLVGSGRIPQGASVLFLHTGGLPALYAFPHVLAG